MSGISKILDWRESKRDAPEITIHLDDDSATWLYDTLFQSQPKDGATKELGRAIYGESK